MWPFTSRRIFGNRWWAVAFVAFVCWQVMETVGADQPAGQNAEEADEAKVLAGVLNLK